MPYCPNCGAFVPSGNSTCSCGTSFILSFREDYEKLRDMYNDASSYERNGKCTMMLALMKEMVIIHVHHKYIIVSLMIFAY